MAPFHVRKGLVFGLEEIVIIPNNNDQNSQLARLVKELFPECKVTVASGENGKFEKAAEEGGQYVEDAERR